MKSLSSVLNKPYLWGLILLLALMAIALMAPAAPPVRAAVNATGTPGAETVLVAVNPKLGQILVGSNGLTLYELSVDTPGVSKCSGACLTAWPPLTVASGTQPTAGMGVTGKLGTITRSDGTVQVTINGLPLYYFVKDTTPGEANGQGITAFGGVWHAVKPDGTPNTGPGSSPGY